MRPLGRGSRRLAAVAPRFSSLLLPLVLLVAAPCASAQQDEPKPKRVEVVVEGVDGDLRTNVEASLRIRQLAEQDKSLPAWRVRHLHERARREIARALEPFGRYRPEINTDLAEQPERWKAVYRIDPGPPIQVHQLSIILEGDGRGDKELRESVGRFPLDRGDALSHAAYEEGKRALRDRAFDRGYLGARFTENVVRLDLEAYRAEVVLRLETGPRHRFGEVTFDQDFLVPELLAGYTPFETGDPYSRRELDELRRNLAATPYFSAVQIRPRPEGGGSLEVPVEVTLTPRPKRKWTFGLGFGTDTGPRGTVGVEVRRFGPRGHRGRIETKVSEVRSSLEGTYEIPGGRRGPRVIALTAGYSDENLDDGDSQTVRLGAEVTRHRWGWRQSIGLGFDLDDFNIGADSGRAELLAPRFGLSRVRADDRIVPTEGYRISFELRGASEDALSNASYVQGRIEGKGVLSFGEGWRVLGRFDVGFTETDDFHDLPPSVRFFAGGDNSVRGYDYRNLGPRDADGIVLGGEALLVGSVELERHLFGRFALAAFVDAGNAMRSLSGPLEVGAGLGLRVRSPIGMVRADLAFGISQEEIPLRFHLTVGPDL
jgi:translocation and assembly module TamA